MKTMRKQIGRTVLAGITACVMGVSGIGVRAEENEQPAAPESGKDETVYVITDASGKTESVIVSDHLKTAGETGSVVDETNLKDIKNVAGDETYQRNADGTITWKADGKDIYYQGTSDGTLPVAVNISYTLDGKPVTAEQIAGKAGHVTVRFDYTNNTSETITVNGKEETVSVPFAMITGAEIDPERFTNSKVTNGKLISEGSSSFLAGIVFPGLRESLEAGELSETADLPEIPEYIEFEADTTEFELGMTMTVAGNNLLNDLAFDNDADLSDLSGKMNQLTDAADQLSDGTEQLRDGTGQLHEGTGKLKNGATDLKNGTAKLKDGSVQLDEGAGKLADGTAALETGAGQLADGAGTLADGTTELNNGAKKLTAGAETLAEGTANLKNGTAALNKGTAALVTGAGQLKEGTDKAVTGAEQLAAGASSAADGAVQLQAGVNQLKNGIEQPASEGAMSLKDGAAAMSSQIGQSISELEAQKQGLEALKKNVFTAVGKTQGHDNDLVLAQQYQNVISSAQALGQAQAQAEAAGKQNMLQRTIDRQNDTILDQQDTIDALKEENQELKEQNEQNEPAVTEVQAAPETSGSDSEAALRQTIAQLQGELEAKEAENRELQGRIDSMQAENDSLHGQLDGAQAEISSLNDQVAALQAENESLRAAAETTEPADVQAEPAVSAGDSAEAKIVLMDQETAPADVHEAMQNLEDAKKAYNNTVSAMLGDGSSDDALIVSQIDAAIAVIDQTIGDDTHGLKALQNGAAGISNGINQLDAGINQLAAGFAGDGSAQNPGLVNGINAVASGASELASGAKTLDAGMGQLKDGIEQTAAGTAALDEGAAKLDGGAQALKTGLEALSTGTDQVTTGAGALKDGADKLSDGASELHTGADTLHEGTGDLKDGTAQLDDGAAELLDGAVQLDDGAAVLDEGALTLLEGMEKFRTEGIDRLAEVFGDELEGVLDRLTAIHDAGTSYRSFTGSSTAENDSVKFIFKTESVKAD